MADDGSIYLDGTLYTPSDLTFREQREMRRLYRHLAEDPEADISEAVFMDLLPAIACVIRRRTDPEFTLEQALDYKPADLFPPEEEAPPTRAPRAARKTR